MFRGRDERAQTNPRHLLCGDETKRTVRVGRPAPNKGDPQPTGLRAGRSNPTSLRSGDNVLRPYAATSDLSKLKAGRETRTQQGCCKSLPDKPSDAWVCDFFTAKQLGHPPIKHRGLMRRRKGRKVFCCSGVRTKERKHIHGTCCAVMKRKRTVRVGRPAPNKGDPQPTGLRAGRSNPTSLRSGDNVLRPYAAASDLSKLNAGRETRTQQERPGANKKAVLRFFQAGTFS